MTQSHYIVDYAKDPAGEEIVTLFPDTLDEAKALARKISKQHGAAYVIRCTHPKNGAAVAHGQAVYYDGRFSHTDDAFDPN